MFKRSHQIKYNPLEKETFLKIMQNSIENMGHYTHRNNDPYNREITAEGIFEVETLHITVWYCEEMKAKSISNLRDHWMKQGFYIQQNFNGDASIPEFHHFHALKTLKSKPYHDIHPE